MRLPAGCELFFFVSLWVAIVVLPTNLTVGCYTSPLYIAKHQHMGSAALPEILPRAVGAQQFLLWTLLSLLLHTEPRDRASWSGVPVELNPVVPHAGASGAAPDWSKCGAAQQFHILGSPAATARATWRYPPGALSPAKAHQGLCFISLHCCRLQLCGLCVHHTLGTMRLREAD